jgi:hypothetical protein
MIAAFAITLPEGEFRVDTVGNGLPAGQADRKSRGPAGTAVTFREYARALIGTLQAED